jgi:hypothetical protein
MSKIQILFFTGIGFLIASCAQKQIALVGLSNDGQSFVKVIRPDGGACGSVKLDFQNQETKLLPLNKLNFDGASVCEATLPKNVARVTQDSNSIVIPQEPKKIVILGDTGCRLKFQDGRGTIQNCDSETDWPFRRIMRSVEKEKPDLVVHLGDYHYREICKGDPKCKNFEGALGYGFKPWALDFLNPSLEVLKTTPYIFVRGNHEDCHRAHEGFLKMLAPLSGDRCVDIQDTAYTNFGDFLIVNFDDSNLDDSPLEQDSVGFKTIQERYKKMVETIGTRPESTVWLFIHRPFWGLSPRAGNKAPKSDLKQAAASAENSLDLVNVNLQKIFKELPLPNKVKMIFSGHIHAVQVAVGDHPPQMVIGESGTSLDFFNEQNLKAVPAGYRVFPSDYGYVLMSKDVMGKWTANIKSINGQTDFACQVSEPGVPCLAYK